MSGRMVIKAALLAFAVSTTSGAASADDKRQADDKRPEKTAPEKTAPGKTAPDKTMSGKTTSGKTPSDKEKSSDMEPQRSASEIMELTRNVVTHVTAAQAAISRGDTSAAKKALDQSQRALEKLYDAPAMRSVLDDLDAALATAQAGKEPAKRLDLAPLAASVRRYQAYIDPAVVAGVDEAAAKAKQGDAAATADALRLARDRLAVEISFLPVEDAYIRVLAAENALQDGDTKRAGKLLQGLPIVVAEMQVSAPLVPVRLKLNAAALAAEEGNWQRSQTLLREATTAIQGFEKLSKGTPFATEISALVDDVEKLNRQMSSDARPRPDEIRGLAKRTRDLGA